MTKSRNTFSSRPPGEAGSFDAKPMTGSIENWREVFLNSVWVGSTWKMRRFSLLLSQFDVGLGSRAGGGGNFWRWRLADEEWMSNQEQIQGLRRVTGFVTCPTEHGWSQSVLDVPAVVAAEAGELGGHFADEFPAFFGIGAFAEPPLGGVGEFGGGDGGNGIGDFPGVDVRLRTFSGSLASWRVR